MEFFGAHITDWVSSIVSLFGLIGIIALYFSFRAYKDDHERSRREKAIEMVQLWTTDLDKNTSSAQKFVEMLSREQCIKIANGGKFKISKSEQVDALKKCFDEKNMPKGLDIATEEYEIPGNISYQIRWLIVQYLNLLETILLSGREGIAKQSILDEQFQYLVNRNKGKTALRTYREANNAEMDYPSITEFIRKLEERELANIRSGSEELG